MGRWSPTVVDEVPEARVNWGANIVGAAEALGRRKHELLAEALQKIELRQRGITDVADIQREAGAAVAPRGRAQASRLATALTPMDAAAATAANIAEQAPTINQTDLRNARAVGLPGTTPFARSLATGPMPAQTPAQAPAPAPEPSSDPEEEPVYPAAPATAQAPAPAAGGGSRLAQNLNPADLPGDLQPYSVRAGNRQFIVDPMAEFNRTQQMGSIRGRRLAETIRSTGGRTSPLVTGLLEAGEPEFAMRTMGYEQDLARTEAVSDRERARIALARERLVAGTLSDDEDRRVRLAVANIGSRNTALSAAASMVRSAQMSLDRATSDASELGDTPETLRAVRAARQRLQTALADYERAQGGR